MSTFIHCETPILAETALAALYENFYDHSRCDDNVTLHIHGHNPQSTQNHYALFTQLYNTPEQLVHFRNPLLGWSFVAETDQDSVNDCLKYLAQTSVLNREIPLLRTFATATTPNAAQETSTETIASNPSVLVFGSETSFGKMAAIVPDNFEIIGAYQESLAEDFLSIKKFDGIVIDKNAVSLEDIRFLRLLHMQPDFVNIPVFMLGKFTFEEAILVQKQGVNLVCPSNWPLNILKTAVESTIRNTQNFIVLKNELRALKKTGVTSVERIFSPIMQKLFMASLESRLKLSRQGIARGTALVLDLSLTQTEKSAQFAVPHMLSPQSKIHYTISKQILDLVQHLSRSEDQIFAISETRIAIILPAAISQDAMRAGARFKAILETSKFRPPMQNADTMQDIVGSLDIEISVAVKCHTIPMDLHDIQAKRA